MKDVYMLWFVNSPVWEPHIFTTLADAIESAVGAHKKSVQFGPLSDPSKFKYSSSEEGPLGTSIYWGEEGSRGIIAQVAKVKLYDSATDSIPTF